MRVSRVCVSRTSPADAELAAKLHGALAAWFEGNPERYFDGDYEGVTLHLRTLADDIARLLAGLEHIEGTA